MYLILVMLKNIMNHFYKKNQKIRKAIRNNHFQPKAFDAVDIKSDITEHPETSQNLPRTIRQAEKVSSNNSLYSDTKNRANFLNKKNVKIAK